MIKSLPLPFILFAALLASSGIAQTTPEEKAAKSTEIIHKMHEVDLLNHLLPVLLKKRQIEPILLVLDKVKDKITKTHDLEYKALTEFDTRLTDLVEKGVTDGIVPGQQVINDISKTLFTLTATRKIVGADNEEDVLNVLKKTLDDGQLRVIKNTINPRDIDPTIKIDKISDEDRMKIFVRIVLLDETGYQLLIKLEKLPSAQ